MFIVSLPEALTISMLGGPGRRNVIGRSVRQMINMATLFYKIWDKTETRTDNFIEAVDVCPFSRHGRHFGCGSKDATGSETFVLM